MKKVILAALIAMSWTVKGFAEDTISTEPEIQMSAPNSTSNDQQFIEVPISTSTSDETH